jgi:hypothetical protein
MKARNGETVKEGDWSVSYYSELFTAREIIGFHKRQ